MKYRNYIGLNQDIIRIRTCVFIDEQGFKNEFDEIDNTCNHIVLYDNNKPVAVCRYFKEENIYHIGRVAIIKKYRGRHLGNEILQIAENEIKKEGGKVLKISAQVRVKNFYAKNGFTEKGKVYLDEFCEHISMEKLI